MIRLNYHFCQEKFYHILDLFNRLNKTSNVKFCQLAISFDNSKEPREKEDELNQAASGSILVKKDLIGCDVKYHCSQAKFLEDIYVYPQVFVRVIGDKGGKVGQNVLYALEKRELLEEQQLKLCFKSIDLILLSTYQSITEQKDLQGLKWYCQLSIKIYILLEVTGQAKVILKYVQCLEVYEVFYSSKIFFRGGETQEVGALVWKSDIKIVKKELDEFDRDIILKEDIKTDMHLFKQIK